MLPFRSKTLFLFKPRDCSCSQTVLVPVHKQGAVSLFKKQELFMFKKRNISAVQKQDFAVGQKQDIVVVRMI